MAVGSLTKNSRSYTCCNYTDNGNPLQETQVFCKEYQS